MRIKPNKVSASRYFQYSCVSDITFSTSLKNLLTYYSDNSWLGEKHLRYKKSLGIIDIMQFLALKSCKILKFYAKKFGQ